MTTEYQPLFASSFLRAHWQHEFDRYREEQDADVLETLSHWAEKHFQKETSAEGTFVDVFFKGLWGYVAAGQRPRTQGFTIESQYSVPGAGQQDGTGQADLAAGYFATQGVADTAQLLSEFKDVRSGLDQPQQRKGNNRSPVKQCFDYLKHVAKPLYGNEPIQPAWGLVTDMNEFRLYHYNTGPSQYQRFVLRGTVGLDETELVADTEDAAFQRFLFVQLFQADTLLTRGGPSPLAALLAEQWVQEKALEKGFYEDYRAYRDAVFQAIVEANPNFPATKGKLVRLTQRFLDRCIFILYCEDMGDALQYPPGLLRNLLREISCSQFYNADDDAAWSQVKRLFVAMRDGTPFGENRINRFNGGLFEDNPELDNLKIPTNVFCSRNQTAQQLAANKCTLLYFSATYNFGRRGGSGDKTIDLYTLGRIFEQSITDLEKMEAAADDRVSLMEITRRKSDGVYYTPEWVTHYIVQETVGARINDLKETHGLLPPPNFDAKLLGRYFTWKQKQRQSSRDADLNSVQRYEQSLLAYRGELEQLKVVDPACGSGAFLIQAFDRLMSERRWIALELASLGGQQLTLDDTEAYMRSILANNIYGVDINPESVEITRLALWLHTALPDRPLTSLDNNIRDGNSLIGPDFYTTEQGQFPFSDEERERINTFDWHAAFPQVFQRGGFDCLVSNPPYVKLQHFRQYQPQVAEYLLNARRDGQPLYASTQTGNFDMYLPFIEKGIELLNDQGRMGYIAPNVWTVNDYGQGLRSYLAENHRLDRWVDFKSYQVFDEAITYTALQFYRKVPSNQIRCVFAPQGKEALAPVEWNAVGDVVPYDTLDEDGAWTLIPMRERQLVERLSRECERLDHAAQAIIVGVQTSADRVYHLERIAPDRYRHRLTDGEPEEVPIEDGIMRPLISGTQAQPYASPTTSMYILYPYRMTGTSAELLSPPQLERDFPLAWSYLCDHKVELESRERGSFRDTAFYRFGRNQNIDKQHLPKLMIPRLVRTLAAAVDDEGGYCLDNVDVNGLLATSVDDLHYFSALLNSSILNFVWRRTSKPFQNDYRSANKQFIAPLPVPRVSEEMRHRVTEMGRELQTLHSSRRDAILRMQTRLASGQAYDDAKPLSWLWADVHDKDYWIRTNPQHLSGRQLTSWAKNYFQAMCDAHLQHIDSHLRPGAKLAVTLVDKELSLLIDGQPLVTVYPSHETEQCEFVAAQWEHACRSTNVTESYDAKKLVASLLAMRASDETALRRQIIELNHEIDRLSRTIATAEDELNQLLYEAYQFTDEERLLVEEAKRS